MFINLFSFSILSSWTVKTEVKMISTMKLTSHLSKSMRSNLQKERLMRNNLPSSSVWTKTPQTIPFCSMLWILARTSILLHLAESVGWRVAMVALCLSKRTWLWNNFWRISLTSQNSRTMTTCSNQWTSWERKITTPILMMSNLELVVDPLRVLKSKIWCNLMSCPWIWMMMMTTMQNQSIRMPNLQTMQADIRSSS